MSTSQILSLISSKKIWIFFDLQPFGSAEGYTMHEVEGQKIKIFLKIFLCVISIENALFLCFELKNIC